MNTKDEKFELLKLDANQLVELDQWENKLNDLVKDNPFIEIVDTETFNEAKKRRTNLKSGRTEVEKQDTALGSFLANFRKAIKGKNGTLVEIVKPHENKQQEEVDRYQKILDDKKAEKDKIENDRIQIIKDKIEEVEKQLESIVEHVIFENINEAEKDFVSYPEKAIKDFNFEEFQFMYDEMIEHKTTKLKLKIIDVKEKESTRIEDLKRDNNSKIDKMIVDSIKAIDEFKMTFDEDNLMFVVDEIFDINHDFGDLKQRHKDEFSKMLEKAQDKIDAINESIILEEKNRIFEVREGLLDKIHQMDVDNFDVENQYVKKALEQQVLEPNQETFNTMKQVVEKALERKTKEIQDEITKEEKRMEGVMDSRIKIIEEMGMVADNDLETSKWIGFGLEIMVDELWDADDIESFVEDIKQAKSDSEAEQQRQGLIKDDKEKMVDIFAELKYQANKRTMNADFENDESKQFFETLRKEVITFCDERITNINKF